MIRGAPTRSRVRRAQRRKRRALHRQSYRRRQLRNHLDQLESFDERKGMEGRL